MIDLRPVGYIIGLLVAVLGLFMVPPLLVDLAEGRGHWPAFAESAVLTILFGTLMALACRSGIRDGLTIQHSFILTTGVWVVLPLFGVLPLMLGETDLNFTDAYFEAMSGVTTTGATVIVGLDDLPAGLLLWRGILQWVGGLGIVIVAMIFLPVMRVGGMQFFRSEGFDTLGKVLPRTIDISRGLFEVYIGLTVIAILTYLAFGMNALDATVHALTSMSTGGFSTSDLSFAKFAGPAEYAGVVFMIVASVPFVRLLQLMRGDPLPIWRDEQVRTYLLWIAYAVLGVSASVFLIGGNYDAATFREIVFNVVSLFSGTGYGSADVTLWGPLAFVVLFSVGAIGGCTGSTVCSIKVFRYKVLFSTLGNQVRRIGYPHRVLPLRMSGRAVPDDVVTSISVMFTVYVLSLGLLSVGLALTGLPFLESVTGAWTAIFNIGPAFGSLIGPTGAMDGFPDAAKWLMTFGMLLGRLEIISVIVLVLPGFWRA